MSFYKYNISKQVKIIILRKPAPKFMHLIIIYKCIMPSKKIVWFAIYLLLLILLCISYIQTYTYIHIYIYIYIYICIYIYLYTYIFN